MSYLKKTKMEFGDCKWTSIAINPGMGLLKTWIYAKLFLFGFSRVNQVIYLRIGFDIRLSMLFSEDLSW